jgi:hypothetical protein
MILFSPSQIKTYRECTRKWALTKIANLRTPSSKSMELGKDVDDNQLQPYLRDARPFDLHREVEGTNTAAIAASGMAFLPPPKWRGLEVQKHFVFESPSKLGFGYQGYLDVWLPFGGAPGFNDELPTVMDFKTTKSIRKWALDEESIKTDPQAMIYSVWAILETKTKELNLNWLYMQTEGTRIARPTQVKVTTDEVAEQFRLLEDTTKEMFPLMKAAPSFGNEAAQAYALTLPPNPNACDNFGGCPFRHLCNLSPEDYFTSIDKPVRAAPAKDVQVMPEMDLFSKLGKKKAAETAGPVDLGSAPKVEMPPQQVPAAVLLEVPIVETTLGVNPPMEAGTPEAPPIGTVEVKPKRGRPKGSTSKKEDADPVEQAGMAALTYDEGPTPAALEFALALEKFLKAVTK